MLSKEFIQLTSKVGVIILMLGIGISVSGLLAYLGEAVYANKATMIGGLVLAAVGHLLVTSRALIGDEI